MRSAIDPPDRYRARVDWHGGRTVAGYVYDTADPRARLVVELWVDGVSTALARADRYVDALGSAGVGDGRYGFAFVLAPEAVEGGRRAQVGLANRDHLLGPGLDLTDPVAASAPDDGVGGVAWQGGLTVAGWLRLGAGGEAPRVRCSVDGQVVAEGIADRWRHRPATGGAHPVHAFSLHLPDWLADGSTRRVDVTTETGVPLRGSPVSLLALPEPLETCVARLYGSAAGIDGARARLFDRLSPRCAPLEAFETWLDSHSYPGTPAAPVAVALVGTDREGVGRSLDSLRADAGLDWVAAALPSPDRVGFAAGDLSGFLRTAASGREAVLVVPSGTAFQPGAIARLTAALAADAEVRLAYGDIALGPAGSETPLAFPAFDYERWLEQGYGALVCAIPTRLAVDARADSLYGLACAAFEAGRSSGVVHVPGLAARLTAPSVPAAARHLAAASRAHLAGQRVAAQVAVGTGATLPAVRIRRRPPAGTVSVVVPTRDRVDLLRTCIASLGGDVAAAELIVVDNGSSDPGTHVYLADVRQRGGRVLSEPGPFDYAHLCNRAVAAARGDFVLLLHSDIEAVEPGWLEELLGRAADPAVAAVGAALRWPSGVVQHAGIVLGPGFAACHACDDRLVGDPGYGDLLCVASEPSAVSGACLLVRRDDYLGVGGMDAVHFPVDYGAIDLCLRLGARGRTIVLTPHLALRHNTAARRGHDLRPDQVRRHERELRALRARWGDALAADPAYSPLLALTEPPYSGLAWPPRSLAPRRRVLPPPRSLPAGS